MKKLTKQNQEQNYLILPAVLLKIWFDRMHQEHGQQQNHCKISKIDHRMQPRKRIVVFHLNRNCCRQCLRPGRRYTASRSHRRPGVDTGNNRN